MRFAALKEMVNRADSDDNSFCTGNEIFISYLFIITKSFLEMLDEYPITDSIAVSALKEMATRADDDDNSFCTGNEILISYLFYYHYI